MPITYKRRILPTMISEVVLVKSKRADSWNFQINGVGITISIRIRSILNAYILCLDIVKTYIFVQ